MDIKYKISSFLQKTYGKADNSEAQIRIAVRYYGNEVLFNVGYTIEPEK